MKRCLYCYLPLKEDEIDFHGACSKKIFGVPTPPELPYTEAQMEDLAKQVVRSQITVTGVQPKLSLDFKDGGDKTTPKRFTIVGLWGGYILKPPHHQHPGLPEIEDLTMHLAELANIPVVPHSLIRLQSGNLAYITKRIDRDKKGKLHMEDMCQLSETMTENKYHGSYEKIAKRILEYSKNPGLDVINFLELVVFSFLTGNADMHLKNFSLIHKPNLGPVLSPAYDLVATALLKSDDTEDLALQLNKKKKRIKRVDFDQTFNYLALDKKQSENIFLKMEKASPKWMDFIEISFISDELKKKYKELISERFERLKKLTA